MGGGKGVSPDEALGSSVRLVEGIVLNTPEGLKKQTRACNEQSKVCHIICISGQGIWG